MKITFTLRKLQSLILLSFLICGITYSSFSLESQEKLSLFQPVIQKLISRGVDSSFVVNLVLDESVKFDKKYVKINVVGSGKAPDYSSHYNSTAVKKSKVFLKNNIELLKAAEKEYGVPKEVITSILYVETRHGNYLGNNHIPSVYFSTAMASQPDIIEFNTKSLKETYSEDSDELKTYLEKLEKRSEFKTNWALEQLEALYELNEKSPIPVTEIYGSWAGAFGMSQFLPTSYLSWAVDGNGDGVINLFEVEDAIYSVANYLKTNGWGKTKKEQEKAVWHYNHSTAYVNAVLKLADLIKT